MASAKVLSSLQSGISEHPILSVIKMPVTNSVKRMPADQTSSDGLCASPAAASGDMYGKFKKLPRASESTYSALPKSRRTARPSALSNTFSDHTSLCTMPKE
jgi:hypothetical protein